VLTGGKVTVLSVVEQIQNFAFLQTFRYSDVNVDLSYMELFEFEANFVRGTTTASVLSYVTHTLKIEDVSGVRHVINCKQLSVFLIASYVNLEIKHIYELILIIFYSHAVLR
jgi:hypothetical protein